MHRRNWLGQVLRKLAAAGCLVGGLQSSAYSQQQEVTLEDRLKAGLKCRQPEEFAFVAQVAQLVEDRQLTPELVLSTYRWAVAQRPDFPFYYFQYGLRRRAAAIGVDL